MGSTETGSRHPSDTDGTDGAPGAHAGSGPGADQQTQQFGAYGSAPHGSQPYGSQPYGSPSYGSSPYGTPGAGAPPPTSTYPPFVGGGQPPRGPRRTLTGIVAVAVAAGLIGGGVGFGGAYAVLGSGSSPATTLSGVPDPSSTSTAADGTVAGAAAKAMPSAVDIQVTTGQGTAEGSGVILSADGNVLTNNHVVSAARGAQITVTLADGTAHRATVVGTAPGYDLAVIKLQGVSGLTPATLGRSGDVRVGEQVVAIGSPQGLTGTVTAGIVSAQNRTVSSGGDGEAPVVYNGLQTDAPINQGNSGGPLVNLAGQVVGINSAIQTAGQSTGSIGLGFAIPVDTARRVAQELMTSGSATRPQLGVEGAVTPASRVASDDGGARISTVQPGSPAANGGLKAGDLVTRVGDTPVSNFTDLVARIGNYAPGQTVPLTVSDGGATRTVQVTLGSVPDTAATTGGTVDGGQGTSPFGTDPFGGGGN